MHVGYSRLNPACSADVKIVKKNLDILISVGLGERAKADLNLCKHTCSIMMQLANEIKSAKDPPPRLEPSRDIFVKLKEVLLERTENGEAASDTPTGGHEESVRCPDVVLCRLLACVGHVGLRQLIYLDVDVYTEMKRLREVAKDEKEKSNKRNKRKSFSATGSGMALSGAGVGSKEWQ
ncbi:hypothetical protein IscW_ISCW020362 [Ixodes scapularis]|uniref:Uncharacterized protein n=1 Tax=Ixodes scapularis TaxID=6945 RepID=B7Q1S7_IXOSC|nr:hypothetical protein IscW_ISCW020362 [Ixodes scapularis]|eukprot:XP_002410087.1 hypothetical protein IscW_ISCW020362 [Ixodes scapularis]